MNKNILILSLKKNIDKRGFFKEIYSKKNFLAKINFVQDNYSYSKKKNTFRGFHYQLKPFSQSKLIYIIKGEILDIIVDIRRKSKTFMKIFKIRLKAGDNKLLFVPKGFAHAFLTLKDNTEVFYKVDNFYSKKHEKGINVKDPKLKIFRKFFFKKLILSKKDKMLPYFK